MVYNMKAEASPGKYKGFMLVRDSEGNPIFDDYLNIPQEISHVFTSEDWDYVEKKILQGNQEG